MAHSLSATSQRHRGFTFVEVLIAITLLAMMAMTSIGGVILAGRMSNSSGHHARAIDLAEEIYEQIMASPHSAVVHGATLPSGLALPADDSPQEFTGVGDMGDNARWAISITDPAESHRLINLRVEFDDPVTGRHIVKSLRFYRFDDDVVVYPYRPAGAG